MACSCRVSSRCAASQARVTVSGTCRIQSGEEGAYSVDADQSGEGREHIMSMWTKRAREGGHIL
eukprot:2369451-Pyramimonas_sp.AAC.1